MIETNIQDLVFQVIGWNAIDFEYNEETEERESANKYLIKMFGVTEQGQSVSVNILDFTPYFFIKINHKVDKYTCTHLCEYIVGKLPYALKNSIIDVKIVKKKDFWGFTNGNKFTFARFKFKNLQAFKRTAQMFSQKVFIPSISKDYTQYKLYESNIEPYLRMMHIRDIDPCGWVVLKKGTYCINRKILPTHCHYDLDCDWKALCKFQLEKIAPLKVASFDIECTSSHGDFPVARKNYKKTTYELTQYFKHHCYDDSIKDTLVSELLKIFDHSEPGVFSKVFTKNQNIKLIKKELNKNMDDIFACLCGTVKYKDNANEENKDAVLNKLTEKFGKFEDKNWVGFFPELNGDPIIQIGTTVHIYGEKECCYRSIVTVGSCDPIVDVEVYPCNSERELLLKWRDIILKLDPDVMTGYNILGFDMSYLYERAIECGISNEFCKLGRQVDHVSAFVEKTLSSSALGDNFLKFIDMEGRVIIDIMKVIQRDHKLDSYKLDTVANHFMKMNKNDIHPSDIFRLQKGDSKDRKIIAEYCVQDCALCNHLMMKLEILANNIGMSNVCTVPLSYIFMRGQGIKIFSLVSKECRGFDFLIPTLSPNIKDEEDNDGYEGAIVLDPQEGIYIDSPISVLDYASLYPSSMISENLSHDSIVLNSKYDNLEGLEYLDITYDIYEKINDNKVKTGDKTVRFVQFPNGEKGTIPKILNKLLKQRKETRKKIDFKTLTTTSHQEVKGTLKEIDNMIIITSLDGSSISFQKNECIDIKDTYNDFQKAVLDGLQNAYKVTANSLYGQCGAKTSPIYMKEIAACTTATGRNMILKARDFILSNYEGAEIIYGDSVTGYTPTLLRVNGKVMLETMENIGPLFGKNKWISCSNGKTGCELKGVEAWTAKGWTRVHRIISHKLASHKKIIRIKTTNGTVDVTDDHSLFTSTGDRISPKNLQIGMELLHYHSSVSLNNQTSQAITQTHAKVIGFFLASGELVNNATPLSNGSVVLLGKSTSRESMKRFHDEMIHGDYYIYLDTKRNNIQIYDRYLYIIISEYIVEKGIPGWIYTNPMLMKALDEGYELATGVSENERLFKYRYLCSDVIPSIEEAIVLGYMCAQVKSGVTGNMTLYFDENEMIEKYMDLCKKAFPYFTWEIKKHRYLHCHGYLNTLKIKAKTTSVWCDKIKTMFSGGRIPNDVFNSSLEIKTNFLKGYMDGKKHFIENADNQLRYAGIHLLKSHIEEKSPDVSGFVVSMQVIPYKGLVYDFTTDNHMFQAGIGDIIVSNTDSLFVKFDTRDEHGNILKGRDAIPKSRELGIQVSKEFKKNLKPPHDLEWEKLFWPFILFSKKRYCANKYEFDDDNYKMNSMGIVLKRRDNAQIVKKIYGGILDVILNEQQVKKSVSFLKESLNNLVDGKYPLEDLVITKSLRADYKDPSKIAHKVLAERMGERDPGTKPQVSDRIPFVYVETPSTSKTMLQGERIEHPDYIKSNNLKPDYEFYITNQIMKPILQLYALALEDLDGFKKSNIDFEAIKNKLIKEKDGDMKKVKDKLNELRECEVKKLLFDNVLIKLQNKRKKNHMITDFFQMRI